AARHARRARRAIAQPGRTPVGGSAAHAWRHRCAPGGQPFVEPAVERFVEPFVDRAVRREA
ncbi:hypothetical protein, partial [Burkholderia pseudomallei]|uniref:hypothetical protein n=1 Tax=Burkholderia pseudomallei TaxID=28450 RepID=UPI0034DFFD23